MPASTCATCCSDCRAHVRTASEESPWTLDNYLQAGTLYVDCTAHPLCSHQHASDSYHTASIVWLQALVLGEVVMYELVRSIVFLVQEHFAAVTYSAAPGASRVRLRIYLIPHDLPKAAGALLRRDTLVLSKAADHLSRVLRRTQRRTADWLGETAPPTTDSDFFLYDEQDNRTLSDIFSQLPSPLEAPPDDALPPGLKSQLYRYQKRTLARMLKQERGDHAVPDPTFLSAASVACGSLFYLQPSTMTIRRAKPLFSPRHSGILCEDMGSGKSCILLALVLATKGQQARPEPQGNTMVSPVVTPVAVRRFPWVRAALSSFARDAGFPGQLYPSLDQTAPSLTALMLNSMRLNSVRPLTLSEEQRLGSAGLLQPLLRNTPFYLSASATSLQQSRRSPRKGRACIDETAPRRFYVAAATVIIVPATLFRQWCLEIEKHCEDGALRCLRISTKKDVLPCPSKLASEYDLILTTHERFAVELKSAQDLDQLKTWHTCSCPLLPRSDVPDCTCGFGNITPLVQCHWKRVVIDEGHSLSNAHTYLASLADLLSSDSIWVVSGTPTTNLIGVGFRETPDIPNQDFYMSDDEQPLGRNALRGSTREERGDLAKLESLLVTFLHLPQITQEVGSHFFRQHVATPFLRRIQRDDGTLGRRFGAAKVMEQVMQQCMVRHRMEDIEAEVGLPPATKEVVMLDLHPMAAMTYNVILALVAGNAVDSDRRDQDYFFHPNNRGALNNVIQNLSQSLFWHADAQDLQVDMDRHVNRAGEILKKAIDQGKTEEDLKLSRDALEHLEHAQNHLQWMPMMKRLQVFVPFEIWGLPGALRDAWAMPQAEGPATAQYASQRRAVYMHPDKLMALRRWILGHPLASVDSIAEHGRSLEKVDSKQLETIDAGRNDRSPKTKKRKRHDRLEFKDKQKIVLDRKALPVGRDTDSRGTDAYGCSSLLRNHDLQHVGVGESMSTKMNYVLHEVLTHKEDKFLIFSSSPLSLAHMSEGMSLARISHLKIMSQVDPARWASNAMTFQSEDSCQCLLMEIRYGARGLNLTRANRIIFLEPVWRADEESQAVKRAHRIGQTKPISIKILAVGGTFEEAMISRRRLLQQSAEQQPRSMLDETGMQSYIESPTFLHVVVQSDAPERARLFDIPLLPVAENNEEDVEEHENEDSPSTPKRMRVVKFAD